MAACEECVKSQSENVTNSTIPSLGPNLDQYIGYCEAIQESSPTVSINIPMSWLIWSGTFVPTTVTEFALDGSTVASTVVYNSVNITSTIPAYFVYVNISSLISSFIPTDVFSELAASAAAAASAASVTGAEDPTSLVYSALEDTSPPPWFRSAVPVTYSTQIGILESQIKDIRGASILPTEVTTATGPTSSVIQGANTPSRE